MPWSDDRRKFNTSGASLQRERVRAQGMIHQHSGKRQILATDPLDLLAK